MAVVVTNRIPVAPAHAADFEARFRSRAGLVEGHPGFIRHEVHRPRPMVRDPASGEWTDDPSGGGHYEVKTWWRSLDDFVAWTKSPSFALAHRDRPPPEMFSGKPSLLIHETVTSTDLDAPPAGPDPVD